MNALANDQLDRLRDMLGGTGITFGQGLLLTAGQNDQYARVSLNLGQTTSQAVLDLQCLRKIDFSHL
jgi:hypothetical protein